MMIAKKQVKNNVIQFTNEFSVRFSQFVHKKDVLTSQKGRRNDLL